MADNYKTMRLVRTDHPDVVCYWGLFQCQVCHGKVYDRDPVSPSDRESISRRVAEMTCSLCDESAPLSERYWMALTTLVNSCLTVRGKRVDCADYGFPSFEKFYSSFCYEDYVSVSFRVGDGPHVEAGPHEFVFSLSENWPQLFDSILNGQIEPLNPRRMAQEVVDRVRHDLKLEYGGNAGSETRTLQDASRESREA